MRFISLCSGIEAASVAFKSLGWSAIAFSEIDTFPSAVLAHHYPDVPNLGDMTQFKSWPEQVFIDADAIVGGPPCQAFSVAGKRASLDDARGNLTLIYTELLDHADRIRLSHGRPAVVCLYENVPGLLSTKDNAFGCFLAQLCGGDEPLNAPDGWPDAGCVSGPSRTAAWRILDAQYFGLAQRRKRVFVVSSARNDFDPAAVLFEFDGVRRDFAPSREAGQEVAHDIAPSLTASGRGVERTGDTRGQDPVVAVPEICGTMKACKDSGGWSNSADHAAAGCMIPMAGTLCVATGQAGAEIGAEIAPTLNCNHEQPYIAFSAGDNGRDAAVEISPTIRKGGDGGGNQPAVAYVPAIAFQERGRADGPNLEIGGNLAFALTAPSGGGRAQERNILAPSMQVRRLTPRECERLQGFPDDYSLVPNRGKPAADGPRYKALGNSWAVPVVAWIGKRIKGAT